MMRALLLAALPILVLQGCATPNNIIEKSAASADLYRDVLSAHGTLSGAIREELVAADRMELIVGVRTGGELDLPRRFEIAGSTQAVIDALGSARRALELSQLLFGTVDRFVRIKVFDLEEAQGLVSKADAALGAGEK